MSAERSLQEIFFSSYEICHEICSEFSPKILSPHFVGQKKSRQTSRRIFRQISLTKSKKKSPASFCRRAGRKISREKYEHFKLRWAKSRDSIAESPERVIAAIRITSVRWAPYCAILRDYLSDTHLLRAMGFSVSQHC